MTYNTLIAEIQKLPLAERLRLIDELRSLNDADALTPEQDAELRRRFELYNNQPDAWTPLEDVEAELDRLLKKSK